MFIREIRTAGAAFRKTGRLCFLTLKNVTGHGPEKQRFVLLRMLLLCGCLSGMLSGCAGRGTEPVLETYVEEAGEEPMQTPGTGRKTEEERPAPAEQQSGTDSGQKAGTGAQSEEGRKEEPAPDSGEDVRTESGTAVKAGSDTDAAAPELTVHVCGAVAREGVYTLPAGSRIMDAVEAAGGFSADADSSWLNLAEGLQDAWQIRVPTKEETEKLRAGAEPFAGYGTGSINGAPGGGQAAERSPETGAETGSPGQKKINLNTASREELMKIPGIGDSKARRILEYREQSGGFETIEDLMKVPGIKKASFQKMKDYVTVT